MRYVSVFADAIADRQCGLSYWRCVDGDTDQKVMLACFVSAANVHLLVKDAAHALTNIRLAPAGPMTLAGGGRGDIN